MMIRKTEFAPLTLRIGISIVFIIMGLKKLIHPSSIIGLLTTIGFPIPTILGWVVLLSELIFGTAVLLGYRVKYAVWPLVIILVVALITVVIPSKDQLNILWHITGIAVLIGLALGGPGKYCLKE